MNIPQALNRATSPQWEVFIQHSKRTDLHLRGNQKEASIQQENKGFGVRVIIPRSDGAGVGFASCNSEEALEATAERAHDLAKQNRSPFFELPTKKKLPTTKTVDVKIKNNREKVAMDYAEIAQSLISNEKDITLTFGKVRTGVVENQILNSRGLSYKSTATHLYVELTLKVGGGSNVTEFWPTRHACRLADLVPDKVIPEWLSIAKTSLKHHPPKTQQTTVILAPNVVCDTFLPTIGFHASAEAVKQNLSRFKKGDKIASDQLTVVDDGLYPYGVRTNPFDDEGQPQQRTTVIEKGVFKDYIYDQLHAQTMGAKSTGNGVRAGFADTDERYQVPPENSTTNLYFKPGKETLEELIHDVKDGLLIYHPAWLNPDEITTRFGSEIRNAQEIKNGELGEGVVGGTLSGTALELIKRITGISDTSEVISGSSVGCVAPYIRFDDVQISGPA